MSAHPPSPSPSPAAAAAAAPGPLSPAHLHELEAGRRRMKKVRRAASVAVLSGWTLAIFGAMTLLGVVFGSLTSLVLGGLLIGLGVNEIRGGNEIRRLHLRGPRRLGWNQIALAVVIGVYAGWKLLVVATGDPLEAYGGSTGDADMDEMLTGLTTSISYALYGGVLVVGTLVPILTARYYFSRARHIRAMVDATPDWVVQTLRTAA